MMISLYTSLPLWFPYLILLYYYLIDLYLLEIRPNCHIITRRINNLNKKSGQCIIEIDREWKRLDCLESSFICLRWMILLNNKTSCHSAEKITCLLKVFVWGIVFSWFIATQLCSDITCTTVYVIAYRLISLGTMTVCH